MSMHSPHFIILILAILTRAIKAQNLLNCSTIHKSYSGVSNVYPPTTTVLFPLIFHVLPPLFVPPFLIPPLFLPSLSPLPLP